MWIDTSPERERGVTLRPVARAPGWQEEHMSYDLYLYRREGAAPLKKKGFNAYFKSRPHFTLNENQAFYENEKTGIYFSVYYSDGKGGGDEEDPNAGREHLH